MKLLKSFLIVILLLALLAACNLIGSSGTPAVVIPATLPATLVKATQAPATPNLPPTQAATATFPPVITATPLPATATSVTKATSVANPTIVPTKGTPVKLINIHMADTNTGWSIGQLPNATTDDILRTSDGGKTWKAVTPPEPNLPGKRTVAYFLDATHAWVTYAKLPGGTLPTTFSVWRTTDGGATWKSSSTSLSGISNMEGFTTSQVAFQDANNGWLMSVVGAGMSHTYIAVFKTSDGGGTWSLIISPDKNNVPMSCSKSGLWFRDTSHGLLAGNCYGVIKGLYLYQTSDGGATWTMVNLPAPAVLTDAFTKEGNSCGADTPQFFDAQKAILAVQCSDVATAKTYRWLYETKDGGATWTSNPLPRAWGGIFFLNIDSGWYLGQTSADSTTGVNVYQTSDGGKNWKQISATQWSGVMDYIDAKNGWVIAKSSNDLAFVRTSDGGLTYILVTPQLAP